MKRIQPLSLVAILLCASPWRAFAGEQAAMVKDNFVNVRGQPNLVGEVITQLKKGEAVTILEEITVEKPNPGDPAKWSRIKMPENTPVWISAGFIDPTNKTVSASRLNLRAGPGENYSVVGRLEKGDKVKEIRTVETWMEIETPPSAYAFVASEYLILKPDPNAPVVASNPTPPAPKVESTVNPPRPQPTIPPTNAAAEQAAGAAKKTEPTLPGVEIPKSDATPPPLAIAEKPATTATNAAPAAAVTVQSTAPATTSPAATETLPKRIVRREGIVRSTFSIQAPTYFELVSPESRKTINYLHSEDPALKLKDFKGKKIVVTGEEGVDARWPNTPVIEIESLEAAP